MGSKRSLEGGLDRDDVKAGVEEEEVLSGPMPVASDEEMKKRKILKGRRSVGIPETEEPEKSVPKINFLKPASNPLAHLMPASDQWQCQACLAFNKPEKLKCECCHGEKPRGSKENKGDQEVLNESSAKKAKTDAPTFSFGSSSSFSFGGDKPSFTFKGFESSAEAPAFTFKADEGEKKELIFNEAAPVSNGEESDTIVQKMFCALYELVKKEESDTSEGSKSKPDKTYVPRCKGDLHFNLYEDGTTKARIIMRMEKTGRLMLNANVTSQLKFELDQEKFIRFAVFESKDHVRHYLLKFRTVEEASEALGHLSELKEKIHV